ncbi:MAG: hypothetical protein GYB64_05530 [Chloroflexi bacterium]|nr:hypothetical protein [Chloroflexota bacterium]
MLNTILAFVLANRSVTSADLWWIIVLALWLLVSSMGVGGLLPILYWRYTTDWRAWLILLAVLVGSGMVVYQIIDVPSSEPAQIIALLYPASFCMVGTAIIVLSMRRDVGLLIGAVFSVVTIWLLVMIWLRYGNVFELFLQAMQPGAHNPWLGWLLSLYLQACCAVPFALIGFVGWTIRIIRREIHRQMPLTPH